MTTTILGSMLACSGDADPIPPPPEPSPTDTSTDTGRFDPVTGDWFSMGIVDHGYGFSFLRFGARRNEPTHVTTMTGGWTSTVYEWVSWDVGAVAP